MNAGIINSRLNHMLGPLTCRAERGIQKHGMQPAYSIGQMTIKSKRKPDFNHGSLNHISEKEVSYKR